MFRPRKKRRDPARVDIVVDEAAAVTTTGGWADVARKARKVGVHTEPETAAPALPSTLVTGQPGYGKGSGPITEGNTRSFGGPFGSRSPLEANIPLAAFHPFPDAGWSDPALQQRADVAVRIEVLRIAAVIAGTADPAHAVRTAEPLLAWLSGAPTRADFKARVAAIGQLAASHSRAGARNLPRTGDEFVRGAKVLWTALAPNTPTEEPS